MQKDGTAYTAIHSAALSGNLELIKWLIDNGSDIKLVTKQGKTLLHLACENNFIELMYLLLEQGFDVNATTKESQTPIYMTAEDNKFEAVKLLFKYGAKLDLPDHKGRTPIYWAIYNNNQEMAEWLYENGGDIYGKYEETDLSLLHIAAAKNNSKMIDLLISKGLDPNIRTTKNAGVGPDLELNYQTPVHRAAKYGALEAIKLLFFYGAELNVQDGFEETPMHLAAEEGHLEVVKWLYAQGCPIDILGTGGRPIHRVSYSNDSYAVLKWLIEQGADINEHIEEVGSPLDIAYENSCSDLVMLLLSHKATINKNDTEAVILHTLELLLELLNEVKNIKDNIQGGLHLLDTFKKFLSEDLDVSDYSNAFFNHYLDFVNYYQEYTVPDIIEKFTHQLSDKLVRIINDNDLDSIEKNLGEKNSVEILMLQNEWREIAQENKENGRLHDALMSIVVKLEKTKLKSLQQTLQDASPHKLAKIAKDDKLKTLVSFLSHPDQMSLAKAYQEDTEPQTKRPKINASENFDNTPQTPLEKSVSGELNRPLRKLDCI